MITVLLKRLTPEGINVKGEEPPDILDIEKDEYIKCPNNIYYDLNVALVNNGVLVKGSVKTILLCKCCNCLNDYKYCLENKDICHYYETPTKDKIDLTDDIREDILLSFPLNLKCSENCKGLCLKCGQNLNINSCLCKDDKQENSWNELDELKF